MISSNIKKNIICVLFILLLTIALYLWINNNINQKNENEYENEYENEKFLDNLSSSNTNSYNSIDTYNMTKNPTGFDSWSVPNGVTQVQITVILGKGGDHIVPNITTKY